MSHDHDHGRRKVMTPEEEAVARGEGMARCGCPHCLHHIVARDVPVTDEVMADARVKLDSMEAGVRAEMARMIERTGDAVAVDQMEAAMAAENVSLAPRPVQRAEALARFRAMRRNVR